MALEQKLHLRMTQKLIMTPSLQQAIKMLQMTKLELQGEITQELTENPLLEELQDGTSDAEKTEAETAEVAAQAESEAPEVPDKDAERDSFEEIDYESYFQDYMDLSYRPQAPSEEIEAPPLENILSKPQSLSDHLLWQLDMGVVPARQKEIARAIIGNLDEAGYLAASLEEIAGMGPYPIEEIERALHLVQELDPPGVGARDLKECLLIQLS
ncbi:MAG: RNA polymerase sigma-54 factor, partial [Acidobacteriota bacterium]